jgi:hypothetical protein
MLVPVVPTWFNAARAAVRAAVRGTKEAAGWPDPIGPWVVKQRLRERGPLFEQLAPCCTRHMMPKDGVNTVHVPKLTGHSGYYFRTIDRGCLTVVTAERPLCARNALCVVMTDPTHLGCGPGAVLVYDRSRIAFPVDVSEWILQQLGANTKKSLEECLPRGTCLLIHDLGMAAPLSDHLLLPAVAKSCKEGDITVVIVEPPDDRIRLTPAGPSRPPRRDTNVLKRYYSTGRQKTTPDTAKERLRRTSLYAQLVPCCRSAQPCGGHVPAPRAHKAPDSARHRLTVVTMRRWADRLLCTRNVLRLMLRLGEIDLAADDPGAIMVYDAVRDDKPACLEQWMLQQLGAGSAASLAGFVPRNACLVVDDVGWGETLTEHPSFPALEEACEKGKFAIVVIQRPAAARSGRECVVLPIPERLPVF